MAGASLIDKIRRRVSSARHQRRFLTSIQHLHGPERAETPQDAVIVVALVRDGMFYLDAFLRHYRALGAAQFVFCDNGSTDGTIERLKTETDVVILRSDLPWGEIENDFRRYGAERYARGRWCLLADMDEMFAFEGDAQIGLPGLTRYLQDQNYTTLVAQMLEMVPQGPLNDAAKLSYEQALEAFKWYDLRGIERYDYHDPAIGFSWFLEGNTVDTPAIQMLFGGLRKRVFGEHCCLTKHPLVHVVDTVEPGVHPHAAAQVNVADFTALIRHYKFAGDTAARDADTLLRGAIPHGEDRQRLGRFKANPTLSLWSDQAQQFNGIAPLYEADFLVRSEAFTRYLEQVRT